MDKSELADTMLQWEKLKLELDELEEEITGAVLELKETQTVGNVRATYGHGRKKYDYERHGRMYANPSTVLANSRVEVNWRAVCEEDQILDVPFT